MTIRNMISSYQEGHHQFSCIRMLVRGSDSDDEAILVKSKGKGKGKKGKGKDKPKGKGKGKGKFNPTLVHPDHIDPLKLIGGDVESIRINLEDYLLPDVNPVAKKSKDPPKRQRENVEDPETKRVRKGGLPTIPPTWRNKHPSELVMSFMSPEVRDGYIMVVLQASSQLPAFGRYCIPMPERHQTRSSIGKPHG